MSSDFRFTPPDLPRPAGLDWVLRRAYGPVGSIEQGSPVSDAELALRMNLAARVASRVPRSVLIEEIGIDDARRLARRAAQCGAQALRLEGTLREVSSAAAQAGVPVAWLKYAALERSSRLRSGARFASDVDVLAPAELAWRLQRALIERGFAAADRGHEHQLPVLTHSERSAVEVHRVLLGVRLEGGRRSAGFAELRASGRLRPSPADQGEVFLPSSEVLAAHAVAHGLGQHGFEPETYSPFRMLGDLMDLGYGTEIESGDLVGWIDRGVPRSEVEALAQLCRALAAGEPPAPGQAEILLRHFVAAVVSPDYVRALKVERLRWPFSDSPRAVALGRSVVRALWPSPQEMAIIYGAAPSRGRRLVRRLWRPVDLAMRFAAGWRARRRAGR